ncbi:MAG TPA: twin-arginine translocase TatA/TatE family subunit [Fimbriimonadaceae bacterium]|jgi:sec-independent protein translocase protein TatA
MIFANILSPEVLIIVLVIVVLLFGAKKIPELMRGVGQGVGELHKGLAEGKSATPPPSDTDKPA